MNDGIEEFEKWCSETGTYARTSYMIVWKTAWLKAQKAQRLEDAEVCKNEKHRLNAQGDGEYAIGADICSDAIMNATMRKGETA